jgi:hypothetical protein
MARKRASAKTPDIDQSTASLNGVPLTPETTTGPNVTKPDPYDPEYLGMSQDFPGLASVKKKPVTIKVERPTKSRVFRVHQQFHTKTKLLTDKDDGRVFLVQPELRDALATEVTCSEFTLLACVTKNGTPFIWPIAMADANGKWNDWHSSAWQIAQTAMTTWTRMVSNREGGYYEAIHDSRPPAQQQQPVWPDLTWRDWLYLGFKDYTIDSLDHPVLRRLRLED